MGDDANDKDDGDEHGMEVEVVMDARVMSAGEKKTDDVLNWLEGVPGADRESWRSRSPWWKSFENNGLM